MKKKVLFLINTLRDGGAEKILVDIVNNMDSQIYDIEVKLIYREGVYLDSLNNNIKLSSISKTPFGAHQVARLLPRLSSELLYKLFIKSTYDIEIAFLEGYATKIIAGAPANTRKVAWVHCDLTKTEWINGVFKNEAGFRECYKKIDTVICVSQTVKKAFIKRFGNLTQLLVKYNPVDVEGIKKLAREYVEKKPSNDKITLFTMGRFSYPKNFMRLLKAVNNIVNRGFNVELWLFGEGEQRHELEQYVNCNNLSDIVWMPGYVANPYPYLLNADLYVCSSIYEGFSTAVTEAIVLGVPVLTTDVSGMQEILGDNEFGVIVENNDYAFNKGLLKMIEQPELLSYYRDKAKERSDFFELKERLSAIEEVL